ncbi:uncharacterized protein LOC100840871 [Brachypodium distachyon]|uniref:uncharacterized protein LOC100840871 n=1 Tax=Brachypodium distachyon TaxID=15368 RepID=UPI000D0CB080|nr:uncharacterized protein LOC100840871 [Brachypodium distachyon]|eukprot:XP_024310466.1 uncharacterized protein LOC100840871 [Brachypodium distachyon]
MMMGKRRKRNLVCFEMPFLLTVSCCCLAGVGMLCSYCPVVPVHALHANQQRGEKTPREEKNNVRVADQVTTMQWQSGTAIAIEQACDVMDCKAKAGLIIPATGSREEKRGPPPIKRHLNLVWTTDLWVTSPGPPEWASANTDRLVRPACCHAPPLPGPVRAGALYTGRCCALIVKNE